MPVRKPNFSPAFNVVRASREGLAVCNAVLAPQPVVARNLERNTQFRKMP